MFERTCLLRLGVSWAIAVSTFSVAAQDTPIDNLLESFSGGKIR